MKETTKTKDQLLDELEEIRQQNFALKTLLAENNITQVDHIGINSTGRFSRMHDPLIISAEFDNYAKNIFFNNLNHNIRTTMNGIIGLTDIVLNSHLPLKQEQYLKMVKNSATLLIIFLNDLIDFSKLDSGQLKLDQVEFQPRLITENVADLFIDQLAEKKLDLHVYVHNNVPDCVVGDPERIKRILANLIYEVMKITEQGEIIVEVNLTQRIVDQAILHFSICNTGPEISNLQFQINFENFLKTDNSFKNFNHLNLGLNVAGKLIEMMGGRIWKDIHYENMNAFNFSTHFPIREVTEESSPEELNKKKIMILTKHPLNRIIIREMSSLCGCDPLTCEPDDDSFRDQEFQLLVLDYSIAEAECSKIISACQSTKSTKEIPVLMIHPVGQCQKSANSETSLSLTNPLKFNDFRLLVQKALKIQPHQDDVKKMVPFKNKAPILLVEDTFINQKLVVALIEKLGLRVSIVNDGKLALDAVARNKFSLILMDIELPNMDGITTTQKIRHELGLKNIPIVALTARTLTEDKEQCLMAGMNDYITKPIEPADFYKILYKWLSKAN